MAIFKTRMFNKWQNKERIDNRDLTLAVEEINNGLIDANLGGGLIKKRISRGGSGKSNGYRTLIATNKNDRWIFIYGFAKKDKDNISEREEQALKFIAKDLLSLNKTQINKAIETNELMEVLND